MLPDVVPAWLDKIITGSPALIFALMWWLERQERLKEREEHKTVSRDMIESMVKTENTLETLSRIFNGGRGI